MSKTINTDDAARTIYAILEAFDEFKRENFEHLLEADRTKEEWRAIAEEAIYLLHDVIGDRISIANEVIGSLPKEESVGEWARKWRGYSMEEEAEHKPGWSERREPTHIDPEIIEVFKEADKLPSKLRQQFHARMKFSGLE